MTKRIEVAIKAASELDKEFKPDTIWETKTEYVLIDEESVGVPPIIVNKRSNIARYAKIGHAEDMKIVFDTSTFVERIQK